MPAAFLIHGSFTSQLRTFYESGGPLLPGRFFESFRTFWLILTGLVTAGWLFHTLALVRRRRPPNPLKVLLLAVTFAFLAYTSSLGEVSLQGYAMFESCHANGCWVAVTPRAPS